MAENLQNNTESINTLINSSNNSDIATIEQPGPIAFDFNAPKPVVNPIYPIKDNVTGVSPNYYPSQAQANSINDPVAAGKALFNKTMNEINNATDRSKYAYAYGYDTSPKNTFRDRHKAYGQETFNRIGFNPLIDNEAWFNAHTTFGDDLSRFWNHAAWPMLTKGFMDPILSYKSIMEGNGLFNADEQSAKDYEYYNAIGQSSKGGLGGFTVNLFNSASYSMGILLEGVLESVLIEGVAGVGGGPGVAGAAGFGLGKFMNRMASLPKSIYQAGKGATKIAQTMNDYTQIYKAKDLFKSAGKNFGNFINPMANTSALMFGHNLDNINDLARSAKSGGALWHDMMVMNLALSEGKLEGGFTKYQTYDKLYNQYMADPENEGRAPSLQEQENMMKEATKASFWNTLNNTALIFYSNKLVFPALTNARFLKGTPKFGFGTVLGDINKEYQLVFKPGKNLTKSTFTKEKIGLVNAIKSLGRPSSYGKVGLNYFKANIVEGAQESLQDVLQEATQNYYVNTYKDPSSKNFMYATGLVSDAIGKQFSGQGAETFLSGFLMGSILQAPSKMKSFMTMGYNDYFRKSESYRTYMEERETEAQDTVDHMNTMWENSDLFFDPRMTNYATQSLLYNAVDDPGERTTKEIHDTKFAAFETAVLSSLQRGTFDMFIDHYEKYKQATPEDLEEAWNLQPGQGAKALDNFSDSIENAKKIAFRWNTAKDKMKQFMLDLNDYEKDSYKYKMAKIYNSAYMQSVFNYVFLQGAFDDTAKREAKLYENLSSLSPLKNSNFANFAGFTDPIRLQREIEMLKTEVENFEQSELPIGAEELARKRKLLDVFSAFKEKQEKLIQTYIAKEKLTQISEEILKQNPGLSKEDLNLQSIDKLIAQYDEGKSNEFIEYKEAFKNLLFGLTKSDAEQLQLQQEIDGMEKGFDGLFDDLLDTHILKNEKAKLAPYINILSNPNDFYDHILRNFQWMRNLYHNKKNVIKDIVNTEIANIEKNTLINELANQGIYVDLDEFAKWVEDPMYEPEYFIDVKNNSVIPREGLLYNEYYSMFERAAELAATPAAGELETDSQVLEGIIDNITEDRDKKIDAAKSKFDQALKSKYDASELELRKRAAEAQEGISKDLELYQAQLNQYKDFLEKLNTLNSSDITDIHRELDNLDVFTEEQLTESVNTIIANPENAKTVIELAEKIQEINPLVTDRALAIQYGAQAMVLRPILEDLVQEQQALVDSVEVPDFLDVEKTEEWSQYQKELNDINEEYEELVKEAKMQFLDAGGNPMDTPEYSVDDDFGNFPEDLQDLLTAAFDDFLVVTLNEPLSLKDDNPEQYNNLRTRWQESDPSVEEIISKYNAKLKQEAIKNSSTGLAPPKLAYGDIVIEPGTPLSNITDLYELYEEGVRVKELTTKEGKVVKLSPEDIKNIKADMKAIAEYIEKSEKAYKIKPIAQEKIELLERTIFNRQDELVVTVNEDGFESRTFRDAEPDAPRPERATEVATQIEQDLTGKKPYIYNRLEDGAIQKLFEEIVLNNTIGTIEERVDAFLTNIRNSYDQFKSDKKINAMREELLEDLTVANVEKVVGKYVNKESSDAGINLDSLIRRFISRDPATGGFMTVDYNSTINVRNTEVKISDLLSKQAFDFMFHPITGSVTKFRRNMIDGQYQVFAENVKVFDRNARDGRGVTGELDLLLIDPEGNLAVVDIKAAKKNTWDNLGITQKTSKKTGEVYDNKANKKVYFTAQQSIYGNSIYNMSGLDADLLLFPLEMDVTMDGYIKTVKAPTTDLSKNNKVSENGMFIILEPLDEAVMNKHGFQRIKPDDSVLLPTEIEETAPEGSLPVTAPAKNTLNELLNQPVMYKGKPGILVMNIDGGFSVELEDDEGRIAIYDLYMGGQPIKNGDINIVRAGLSKIAEVESVGQVTQINNTTIDAKFLDKNERTAEINGVRYTINRDSNGAIVSLTFNTNDKEIAETQREIEKVNREITELNKKQAENKSAGKEREITKKSFELKQLINKKTDLINKNKKRTLRGGNANDYIFALNRLPNKFKDQVPSGEPTDREDQVSLISQLSESAAVTTEIDRILFEHGMPQEVENIIDGKVENITQKKVDELEDWGVELIIKLEEYQSRLLNEQRSTVPVDNVIETINEFLNNIGLLKFRKDGKITAQSRKEFERAAKVQPGTNVSSVPKPAGTTTTGVSGQAVSGEELTQIIEQSRKKIQGINLTGTDSQVSTRLQELLDLKESINKNLEKNDLESLEDFFNEVFNIIDENAYQEWQDTLDQDQLRKDLEPVLSKLTSVSQAQGEISKYLLNKFIDEEISDLRQQLAAPEIQTNERDAIRAEIEAHFDESTDDLDTTFADGVLRFVFGQPDVRLNGIYSEILDEVMAARIEAFENDMSFENLVEESILINTQPIGTNKKLNENFIIQSKNETEKTVTLYNPKRKKSFTFTEEEIKNNFMKPVDETKPVDAITVTPQVKENIKSTSDNVQDLVKDADRLDSIEEDSKNKTKDDRLGDIFDIFNQC